MMDELENDLFSAKRSLDMRRHSVLYNRSWQWDGVQP